jgi:hypothetical protein
VAKEVAKRVGFQNESIGRTHIELFVDKIKKLGDESAYAVMAPAEKTGKFLKTEEKDL